MSYSAAPDKIGKCSQFRLYTGILTGVCQKILKKTTKSRFERQQNNSMNLFLVGKIQAVFGLERILLLRCGNFMF
jgi:hypothetical protein